MTEHVQQSERTIADYVAILRRRKWIILQAALIIPIAAYIYSSTKPKEYSASADVLLTSSVTQVASPLNSDTQGIVDTQTQIASTPDMAERVVKAAKVTTRSAGQVLGEMSVAEVGSSDVLRFTVTDRDPAIANVLANAYAAQYTTFRRQLDSAFIDNSRKELEARIKALRSAGDTTSATYQSLVQKDQQLLTIQALDTASAIVIRTSSGAFQVAPRPKHDAILGLIVGLLLGVTLALLREALDSRLWTASDIADLSGQPVLGRPLLGRISAPPKRIGRGLVTLEDPSSPEAEAFRLLRSNLEFVLLDRDAKVLMVTSALQAEGKSTTAANLAATIARSGKKCILVDLDLRRPMIETMFNIDSSRGLTTVAVGKHTLDEAIVKIPVFDPEESMTVGANGAAATTNGHGGTDAMHFLEVLPSGPLPPDPGEFVMTGAVQGIIQALRDRADVIIVDTPPLLGVGDAAALSGNVDAIVLLIRVGVTKRQVVREAFRIVDRLPKPTLGFVLTGAEREESYGYRQYGYDYYSSKGRRAEKASR